MWDWLVEIKVDGFCKNRPRMIYNLATTDPLIIIIIIIIYGEGGDDDDGQMQAVDVSM